MFQPQQNDVQFRNARPRSGNEEGFILLAVLFLLVLLVLAMAVAAPKIAVEMQREKEIETIHRGMEYARAIRVYYRTYGRYPNSIDQLIQTDNKHFLRKRYLDPLTGKDDWRLIHLGEAQTMGTGASGQPGSQNSGTSGTSPTNTSGSSGQNGPGSSGSGFSGFGSSGFSSSSFGSSTSPGGTSFSNSAFSLGSSGSTGSTSPATGTSTGTNSNGSGSSFGNFGSFGQNLPGAPIVGVGLPSTAASLKVFRKQTHYNQWEFIYDPSQDLGGAMGQTGAGVLQQPGASNGVNGTTPGFGGSSSPGFGSSNTGGFSLGNSGIGGSNTGGGGTSTQPTTPPPTQMDSPIQ